jgi:hypothetical protein
MRRYLLLALPILVAAAVAYVVGSTSSARHPKAAAANPPPAPRATVTTSRETMTSPRATSSSRTRTTSSQRATATVTTAPTPPGVAPLRTDCRWRLYHDGAIGTDPACAPGQINRAVIRHTAQTICNRSWLAAAGRLQPPASTKDDLLYEYQLPGNPLTYVAAPVIPVEDGGSPTSPRNLYPLHINGWGGQETRTLVADQVHDEICSDRITVARAASMLEGDWLSKGLPDND